MKSIEDNPYLQSRALWHDLYGDVESRLRKSQRLNIVLCASVFVLTLGLVITAHQTKIKSIPFIIHGNHIITAIDRVALDKQPMLKAKLMLYSAKRFIKEARQVSIDSAINRRYQLSTLSKVQHSALATLKAFYQQRNNQPHKRVNQVNITSVLQRTAHTVVIRWQEVWQDQQTGKPCGTIHYVAELSYHSQAPSQNEMIVKYNPLGFYIDQLSWSKDEV